MIQAGDPSRLGAQAVEGGVNFALYSGSAERVELCLFDERRRQVAIHELPACSNGVWHGFLPGCAAGQRYGYRVDGLWAPARGMRHNPAKLLIDPYARRLDGAFEWNPAVFDFHRGPGGRRQRDGRDSAPFVPLAVVAGAAAARPRNRPAVPWSNMVVYEANVRGYTMRHPDLGEEERGRFRGLRNGRILEYLRALGITSLELMPLHSLVDEQFLVERGLRNLWGYNSVQFFTPDARFAPPGADPAAEFREMVDAIHDAGIEVILDVAYNHTGEGGADGPTFSLRGIDNLAYYRTLPDEPGVYVNDTGCGKHPRPEPGARQPALLASGTRRRRFPLRPGDGAGPHHGRFLQAALPAQPNRRHARTGGRQADRGTLGPGPRRLPIGPLPGRVGRVERPLPRQRAPLLAWRRRPGQRVRTAHPRLGGPVRIERPQPGGERQFRHRARRVHAG